MADPAAFGGVREGPNPADFGAVPEDDQHDGTPEAAANLSREQRKRVTLTPTLEGEGIMAKIKRLGAPGPKESRGFITALPEAAMAAGSGLVGTIAGGLSGLFGLAQGDETLASAAKTSQEVQQSLTYKPRGLAGQIVTDLLAKPMELASEYSGKAGGMIGRLAGNEALGQTLGEAAPAAAATVLPGGAQLVRGAALPARTSAAQVGQMASGVRNLFGTRAATTPPATNPGQQAPAGSVGAAGIPLEQQRRLRAAALGADEAGAGLTKGQATRDKLQIGAESELEKTEQGMPISERKSQQRAFINNTLDQFIDNLDTSLPADLNVFGRELTGLVDKMAKKQKKRIKKAYDLADNSEESLTPVSTKTLQEYINAATPTEKATLAPILKAVEERIAMNDPEGTGMITVKEMEKIRQSINKNVAPGTANMPHGIEMKKLIDAEVDSTLERSGGDLYKAARAERVKFAKQFENRQVIADLLSNKRGFEDRKISLPDVFKKTVLEGDRDDVMFLRKLLRKAGPEGDALWKEVQAQTIRHLRDQVLKTGALDEKGVPVPSLPKMRDALNNLEYDGKLDAILTKEGAEPIRQLKGYMDDIMGLPPGTPINWSNTASRLMNALDYAEKKTRGVAVLHKVVDYTAKATKKSQVEKMVDEALK